MTHQHNVLLATNSNYCHSTLSTQINQKTRACSSKVQSRLLIRLDRFQQTQFVYRTDQSGASCDQLRRSDQVVGRRICL